MKKLLVLLMLIVAMTMTFAACLSNDDESKQEPSSQTQSDDESLSQSDDESIDTHEHSFTVLRYDENGHWYECESGDGAKLEVVPHTLSYGKDAETHYLACSECEYVSEAVPHDFGETGVITTAPTCTENGEQTFTCVCGATKTESIDKLDHKYEKVEAANPSCTEDGHIEFYECGNHCGKIFVLENGEYVEIDEDDIVLGALGHDLGEWTVSIPATCTAKGEEKSECSRCDYYETRETDMIAHTPVTIPAVPATCTATGLTEGSKCSVCETILVEQQVTDMIPHTPDTQSLKFDENSHWYTCAECGTAIESTAHSASDFAMTADTHAKYCDVCNYEMEAPAAHSKAWTEKDGVEHYACTVCGYGEEDDYIVVKIAERQDLYLNVDDSANPTGNISLDIGGIGNYSELVKVSFAGTQISESLTFAAEKFGKNYGEKDIIATVKTADGATHEVVVPVTLITKIIYNFDDMNKIRAISTAIGGGFSGEVGQMTYVWGGHFILGADLDYDGASMLYTDMINYKDEFWTPMKNDARLKNNGIAWQNANNGAYGFQGTFDGRGHVINGYLSRYEQGGFLASCIGGEGVIKNVNFTNAILDAPAETNNRGYCLLPYVNFGTLENIYIDIAELNVYGTRFGALSADGNGSYLKAVKNVVIDYSATKITNVTLVTEGEEQKAYIYADFFGSKVKNTSVENLYVIKGNGVAALENDFRTACASTVVFDGKEAFLANENVGAMLKSMNIDRKLNYAVAEVDLDTNYDGSLNTEKTVEIDLAEVLGEDDGKLVSVKIADKTIEGAALNGTTLTATAASFGYAYYYMDMTVRTENNVYVVPVSFITKTINTKADLDAMPTISKAVYADNANLWGGYFVFGSDIEYNAPDKNYSDDKNTANVWTKNKNNVISGFACSDDYKVGGFKGVIDGRGHDISRFIVSYNVADNKDRAFVSHLLGGTIQNLSFTKASIGPHAQLLVSRSSNHNGKIRNIYVSMEYLNVYRTGYVTPANNDLIHPDNAVLFGFNDNESSQSRGTSKYLTVKNCIVDFGDLYDAETMLFGKEGTGFKAKNTYLLGKFFSANKTNYPFDTLNGVYVIGIPDAYVNVAASANGSGIATGVWGRYATAADMLADEAAQARIAQFDAQYWTIVNGVPVFKGLTDKIHYHAYEYVAEIPASCKETGVIGHFTCDGCDKKFVATAHGFYCEVTDEELVIPMTAHTFGDWQPVKAATCTEKGEEKRICSVCGEVETREIELAAHEMTKHDEVKASCTATGMKEYYSCSLCNYNYLKDDEGNFVKATEEELIIPMTAHTPDQTSLQKDETGHWFNCTVCGQAIDKAAHTSSEWLIGENGHYKRCTVCEYITVPEEEHTYEWVADELTNTEFKACSLCKYNSGETIDLTITQRQDIDLKSTTTNYILSQSPILNGQFGELVHKADDILLDLSEIGTNLTVTKVVFENYVTGYALNEDKKLAISTEAARELSVVNGKIPAQEFGKNYGEATLKVTFTTADGAEHETSVPVTLVNMFLTNKDDFIQMKRVAHTITGGDAIISYGGYFALAADVDFEGSTLGYGSLISNNNTAWARFKDVFGSAPVWVDHPDLGFRGTFDGRGHVISNYTVTFTQTGFLTNIMATEGTIKNVNFLNAKLIKEATGNTHNGNSFFPWINNGQLENIYLQLNEVDAPKNDSTWAVVNGAQYKNRALINNLIIDFSEATSVNVSGGTASKYTFYAVSHYYYPVLADGRVGNENVFIIYNPETITPVFNKDTDDTQLSVHFNTVYLTPKTGTPYIVDNFDSYEKFADNDKVKAMLASWNPFENIHVYGAWKTVKPATCTEKGEESRQCLFCDKTETREIALKAHSLTKVEAVNATCTQTGTYEYYICSECNRKFVEKDGDYTLVTDEELVMPMTEHTPDQTSLQKDETGHWFNCSVCGQAIDKAAHSSSNWIVSADGHYKKCTVCDYIISAEEAHTFEWVADEFTGTEIKVCSVCQYNNGEVINTSTTMQDVYLDSRSSINPTSIGLTMQQSAYGEIVNNATVTLDLSEVGANVEVVSVVFNNYISNYSLDKTNVAPVIDTVSEKEIATSATFSAQAFGRNFGKATLTVTVKTSDDAQHLITVPVTLINYVIRNVADLKYMRNIAAVTCGGDTTLVYGGYFVLGNDIEVNGTFINGDLINCADGLWSLCNSEAYFKNGRIWQSKDELGFRGTIDGRGYSIRGYQQTNTLQTGFAMSYVSKYGTIKNVNFLDSVLKKPASGNTKNGGSLLPWKNFGTIENVYVEFVDQVDVTDNLSWGALGAAPDNNTTLKNVVVDYSKVTGISVEIIANSGKVFYIGARSVNTASSNVFAIVNPDTYGSGYYDDNSRFTVKPFYNYETFFANDKVTAMLESWNPFNGRVDIDLDINNDGTINENHVAAVNLSKAIAGSDLGELKYVKLNGEKLENVTLDGTTLSIPTAQLGYAYGYNVMTVVTANGRYDVPVTLVSKVIRTVTDFNNYGNIAYKCEENDLLWGGYFVLGNDITWVSEIKDVPVYLSIFRAVRQSDTTSYDHVHKLYTDAWNPLGGFCGTFDGRGHNIKNLVMTTHSFVPMTEGEGAFITILYGGTIKNVSFTNAGVGLGSFLTARAVNKSRVENVYVDMAAVDIGNRGVPTGNKDWISTQTGVLISQSTNARDLYVKNLIVDFRKAAEKTMNGSTTDKSLETYLAAKNMPLVGRFMVEKSINVYAFGLIENYEFALQSQDGKSAIAPTSGRYGYYAGTAIADDAIVQARLSRLDPIYWNVNNGIPTL